MPWHSRGKTSRIKSGGGHDPRYIADIRGTHSDSSTGINDLFNRRKRNLVIDGLLNTNGKFHIVVIIFKIIELTKIFHGDLSEYIVRQDFQNPTLEINLQFCFRGECARFRTFNKSFIQLANNIGFWMSNVIINLCKFWNYIRCSSTGSNHMMDSSTIRRMFPQQLCCKVREFHGV